jgi:hypothetical protein
VGAVTMPGSENIDIVCGNSANRILESDVADKVINDTGKIGVRIGGPVFTGRATENLMETWPPQIAID